MILRSFFFYAPHGVTLFFIVSLQLMNRTDLTQGSIWGNITTFLLPYILAYFLQILYGLADLFVIGRYCGVDGTTAVSNGAQVMYFVTCVVIGLAMGTTVNTAHAIGAKDQRRASRVIGNTATMFFTLSILLALVLLCCRDGIVRLMDTPPEAIEGTRDYLMVCFIGIPFIMAYNVIASIFRGLGDSKSPMYFVAVACVVNILLDFFFIGYLGWGARGAALGTTLSQMFSVMVALLAIRRHREVFDVHRHDFRPNRQTGKSILKIGFPIAMQDGFIQLGFLAIAVIANGRGVYDAGAVGIVEKFIGLVFILPSAMLSTVSAICSQNYGAGNLDRVLKTLRCSLVIIFGYGMLMIAVWEIFPEVAVGIFTDDPVVVEKGAVYLQGYIYDCLFAGIHFCFSGLFTACGYSIISFVYNFLSVILVRIPLAYLASEMYPETLYPMGITTWFGSLFSVIICVVVYRWMVKHHKFSHSIVAS